jgi:hypothetical protein
MEGRRGDGRGRSRRTGVGNRREDQRAGRTCREGAGRKASGPLLLELNMLPGGARGLPAAGRMMGGPRQPESHPSHAAHLLPQGVHAGPGGPRMRCAAGAWLSWPWRRELQHPAAWRGPRAGASLSPAVGRPRCSTIARPPPASFTYASTLKPASTPHAGENVQRERTAQQPRLVQAGRALLLRLLHCRGHQRALLPFMLSLIRHLRRPDPGPRPASGPGGA